MLIKNNWQAIRSSMAESAGKEYFRPFGDGRADGFEGWRINAAISAVGEIVMKMCMSNGKARLSNWGLSKNIGLDVKIKYELGQWQIKVLRQDRRRKRQAKNK